MPLSADTTKRLLLVGGGHAHIQVFRDFAGQPPPCAVTVLVDRPIAMYSGMVPGFVAGRYTRAELSLDVRAWAERLGAEYVEDRATGFDPARRLVHRAGGESIAYDVCSWNIGSTVHGLPLPGVKEHALATRPIGDFVERVHERLAEAVARQARTPGEALRIVVVGGGAAGVELAACLQQRVLAVGATAVDVQLCCSSAELLPGSPPSLRRRLEREFSRRGISIRRGTRITAVHAQAVELEGGERIAADLVLWVTGAASHLAPLPAATAAEGVGPTGFTPHGWIPVSDSLQHVDHAEVFAAGDCAQLVDHPELPKAGVYSVRMGPVLTHNLRAAVSAGSTRMRTYEPQSEFLALLNLGDGRAAGSKWGWSFSGRWVMTWKNRIDRAFMQRFG